jgi:hypothetical protein
MYCPSCGTEMNEQARFCGKCGKANLAPQFIATPPSAALQETLPRTQHETSVVATVAASAPPAPQAEAVSVGKSVHGARSHLRGAAMNKNIAIPISVLVLVFGTAVGFASYQKAHAHDAWFEGHRVSNYKEWMGISEAASRFSYDLPRDKKYGLPNSTDPLTEAKYKKLQPGTRLSDVQKMFGWSGMEIGDPTNAYTYFHWENQGHRGQIECAFVNGEMVGKNQQNLE